MTTYKSLYHLMVRSMSEAIDLYDEGKGILAREVLRKALLDAEEQVITHDIIPDEPIGRFSRKLKKSPARRAQQFHPHAVCRRATVTRASRSKARLRVITRRRDSWRSHVHRTYIAQRLQSFKLQTANVGGRGDLPSSFSRGI